jgi:tyrosyl-tRNA synthetase
MDVKFELARTVTADFHDAAAAQGAEAHFRGVHQRRETPDEVDEVAFPASAAPQLLAKLLTACRLATSNGEARRLLEQGGVKVDGETVRDAMATLAATAGTSALVQVGKRRFARLRFVA